MIINKLCSKLLKHLCKSSYMKHPRLKSCKVVIENPSIPNVVIKDVSIKNPTKGDHVKSSQLKIHHVQRIQLKIQKQKKTNVGTIFKQQKRGLQSFKDWSWNNFWMNHSNVDFMDLSKCTINLVTESLVNPKNPKQPANSAMTTKFCIGLLHQILETWT